MKNRFSILLILLSVLFLSACGASPEVTTAEFTATVLEFGENHAIVMPVEGEDILRSSDKISFSISGLLDIGAQPGDIISVAYSGEVMESYPAQIVAQSWSLVKKAEQENNMPNAEPKSDSIDLSKVAEYSFNDVFMRVKLPSSWSYSITSAKESASLEGEFEKFGITFWPEEAPELSFEFFYHPNVLGICGTGVTFTDVEYSTGLKGTECTEQIGEEYWFHLVLEQPYEHYSLDSCAHLNIWSAHKKIIDEILNTIEVGGNL